MHNNYLTELTLAAGSVQIYNTNEFLLYHLPELVLNFGV
jgi:hypothetical protein